MNKKKKPVKKGRVTPKQAKTMPLGKLGAKLGGY